MRKLDLEDLFRKQMTRKEFFVYSGLIIASMFSIIGVMTELLSKASGPYTSAEAESGKLTGSATSVAKTGTSGGKEVQFGATTNSASAKVYMGGWANEDVPTTEAFVNSFGANPAKSVMMSFPYGATWSNVQQSCVGIASNLGGWPGLRMIAIPMQTTGSPGKYTDVTSGANDAVFIAAANACVANGVTLIRLGWELQNNPSNNMPAPVPATLWKQCFQHIVTVMRKAQPNGGFKFIFNPNDGTNGGNSPDWMSVYPGKSYVDIVAVDAYDNNSGWAGAYSGATPNLQDISSLAATDGLDLSLPEWSLINTSDSYASGDDPTFVNNIMGWAHTQQQTGKNIYLVSWGDGYPDPKAGTWGLQCSPKALAALKAQVSAGIAGGWINN